MVQIIRNKNRRKPSSKFFFDNHFEERKIFEYLKNLINSQFITGMPHKLFSFATDIIGQPAMLLLLTRTYPEIRSKEIFKENDDLLFERPEKHIPHKVIISLLRMEIAPLIEKRLERLSSRKSHEIEERLNILKETFNLSKEEIEVIVFYHLANVSGIIRHITDGDRIIDLSDFSTFKGYGHVPLGLKKSDISKVFSQRRLIDIGIFGTIHQHGRGMDVEFTIWSGKYLSCIGKRELSHKFISTENDISVALSDIEVSEDEMMVLDTLMKRKAGQNILFYGEPGTGKTSLAKCLAKEYGMKLVTVKVPENNNHQDRISAIYAAMNFANGGKCLILVDEADELLNTHDSIFGNSKTNKSWINNLLESHDKKIIWCTNRFYNIHPSTMRRFSFTMEFKSFSYKNRLKVIKNELGQKGYNNYFNEEELQDICRTYSVNAGGIVNAVKILGIDRKTDKETALKKVKAVLRNHEKVVAGKSADNKGRRNFGCYSLEGLNCSEDLRKIIPMIRRHCEFQGQGKSEGSKAVSLLLYGMPGTGKSEFVHYMGHELDKEVLLKRCSDIQSMWVGETEKNIAKAFHEAQEDKGILFFDEADSFLFPRKGASHSWEKSFTNEILTRLESYTGIVVFATNDIDGLDHASLRRFRFKIEFKPLTPDGNLHFYNTLLAMLAPKNSRLPEEEIRLIKDIKNLTPGDFSVVKDKYAFADDSEITHKQLIESLINEIRYKKSEKRIMGFGEDAG